MTHQFWYLILNRDGKPCHSLQPTCTRFGPYNSIRGLKFAIRDENISIMTLVAAENMSVYRSRSEFELGKKSLGDCDMLPPTSQDNPAVVVLPQLGCISREEFAKRHQLDTEAIMSGRFFLSKIMQRLTSMFWIKSERRILSFSDIARARNGIENVDWRFIGEGPRKSLEEALDREEWKFLLNLNESINRQLDCAELFRNYEGEEFVRIHSMCAYSDEEIKERCKSVLQMIDGTTDCKVNV